MKKTIFIILSTFILACGNNEIFYSGNTLFKGRDAGNDTYLMFLSDTIAAINFDNLKTCNWEFAHLNKFEKGLYKTDELGIDTFSIVVKADSLIFRDSIGRATFGKTKMEKKKMDSLIRHLDILKSVAEKGIFFSCDYSLEQANYFYKATQNKVKSRLKNPNSAKFKEFYISRYKTIDGNGDYSKTTTTKVSVDVESKNGLGNYIENTYYIFFMPKKEGGSNSYYMEFSESFLLDYDLRDKLEFEKNNAQQGL